MKFRATVLLALLAPLVTACTAPRDAEGTYVQHDGHAPVRVDGSQPVTEELPEPEPEPPPAVAIAPGEPRAPAPPEWNAGAASGESSGAAVAASFARGATLTPPRPREPEWTAAQLSIWRDPRFRKRFTEGFAARLDAEPTVTLDERETLEKVADFIAEERTDRALDLLRREGGSTSSAAFDAMLAGVLFQQERYAEAVRHYEIAVLKHPSFLRAWRFLGAGYMRLEQPERALPALTRVVELGGGDAFNYGLLGFAYLQSGNSLSAESAYRMAVLLDPLTMDWKRGLARALFEQSRWGEAVALCESLIAADPDRAEFWLLQAGAYVGLGEPLKAAENYELVDRMGKATSETLERLGNVYMKTELTELAADAFLRALERDPRHPATQALFAARVMGAQGALADMETLLDGIGRLREGELAVADQKTVLKLRARLAMSGGATDEQVRLLEETVALDPFDGEALLELGRHARLAGEPERAIVWLERAASLEAFEPDAKVGHAQVLVGQGRYGEALPLLRRAQDLRPREHVADYLEQVERLAQGR